MTLQNSFQALLLSSLCFTSHFTFAKKYCKPLLEKVHKIQKSQRHGYSLKQGYSLREKEDKARKAWWNCEKNTKSYQRAAKKKGLKKKSKVHRKLSSAYQSDNYQASTKRQNTLRSRSSNQRPTALLSSWHYEEINFLAGFKAEKLTAWQSYYQPTLACLKPQNLSSFVACSEKKKEMKQDFEQKWPQLKDHYLVKADLVKGELVKSELVKGQLAQRELAKKGTIKKK
jgi:hypothetical protein